MSFCFLILRYRHSAWVNSRSKFYACKKKNKQRDQSQDSIGVNIREIKVIKDVAVIWIKAEQKVIYFGLLWRAL